MLKPIKPGTPDKIDATLSFIIFAWVTLLMIVCMRDSWADGDLLMLSLFAVGAVSLGVAALGCLWIMCGFGGRRRRGERVVWIDGGTGVPRWGIVESYNRWSRVYRIQAANDATTVREVHKSWVVRADDEWRWPEAQASAGARKK